MFAAKPNLKSYWAPTVRHEVSCLRHDIILVPFFL